MLRQLASLTLHQPWIKKAAVTLPGVRDLAWRFVAGEDLEAALGAVRTLNARGIKATLNYVGTHVRTEPEAVAAADAALESLRRIAQQRLDANVSVKLTHLGLDISEDLCRAQLRRVLDGARQGGGFVRVDMEESAYVERTLRMFEDARETHGNDTVGIVLQSYLRSRRGDLDGLVAAGARVRLVKGGYWEAAAVVYRKRADIDAAFLGDIDRLVARGRHPAIATHDTNAIHHACRVAADAGLERRALEFQMLYGVRPALQAALVRDGYPVRAYVPYGSRWYEYVLGCIRRLPGGALRQLGERLGERRRSDEGWGGGCP
ncbi:proline dehydrogenase family protein [Anaeromyxobacter oryzisoli]|uniref:proline dehydrogenase family protein n=1 Tax=Anaeromyxobacter oryzisoli TaxID=2925408 RepID=UPI001F5763C6|nr:proline dehydrogenase family protein [Anaeromyxobacter sp. SG63]